MTSPVPSVKYVTAAENLRGNDELREARLIFTHIPKAAGTTLDRIISGVARARNETYRRALGTYLGQWLGEEKDEATEWLKAQILTDGSPAAEIRYLTGHIPFGVHALLPGTSHYATIVREPISRCISQFRMGVQRGAWSSETPIESLYASAKFIADPQTRQISGGETVDEPCGESQLATAIDNLSEHYLLAATTEQFNDLLKVLIALFEWPDIAYGDFQVSAGEAGRQISDENLASFRHHNQFDMQLYDAVCRRPTIWNAGLVLGPPDAGHSPSPRQDAVLVIRPHGQMRFMEQSLFRELEQELISTGQQIAYF